MARAIVGLLFAWGALALAGAARAEDGACADPQGGPTFANTRWEGTSTWEGQPPNPMSLFLRADCKVEYTTRGRTFASGRWVQRGSLIEWDMNDHFAVYLGQAGLGQMGGVMYNRRGQQGTWRFRQTD